MLDVSQAIASHLDLSALVHSLAACLRPVVRFDYLALILHEPADNTFRRLVLEPLEAAAHSSIDPSPPAESPTWQVWEGQEPVVISDAGELGRWPSHLERARSYGVQSMCELPLTSARRRLGTLVFACKQPAAYHPADLGFLRLVANQVAVAVENALAFREIEAVKEQLAERGQQYLALLAVSEVIVAHRDLRTLFPELAGRIPQLVRFDYMTLILHEPATNTMRLRAAGTPDRTLLTPDIALAVEDDPAGLVWQTQRPLVTSRLDEVRRWPRLFERIESFGAESICWLPLTTARRRLGALAFGTKQRGAYDRADLGFLQRLAGQVAVAVENALAFEEIEALREQLGQEKAYLEEEARSEQFGEMIAVSTALRGVLKKVETVAPTDSTVLICGETGTGKELIARAVHDLSPRRERTFVKLNCAAIPTGLLESELFGHEKGAFTGAVGQRVGRFELAHKGTLFLDEVGDIPPELQPKLLRVLQEQEFERLGGTRTIKVDVRLVAATNRDLARMVAEGRFRNDLYYRLNVFPVLLPPLRERRDGIPSLVRHFTERFARRMGRRIDTIPAEVMDALVRYSWPGNVRELQNVIERAVILSPGPVLQVPLADLQPADPPAPASAGGTHAEADRERILAVLRATGWVIGGPKGAAARLGMKRSALYRTMDRLGITRPD